MLIGKKLKALRQARKMTLTALSQKSGVQLATLSRIEHERMVGRLDSHQQIAHALGITLTDLYTDSIKEGKLKKVDVKTAKSASEVFVHSSKSAYEILTPNVLSKRMMPILLKIDSGGSTNPEENRFGTEKFIFVLEGKVDVKIEKEIYPLTSHHTLYFDASVTHQIFNRGTGVAKLLCVVTPVAL